MQKKSTKQKKTSIRVNESPVVGILTQPCNETSDYIASAYVKFVEASGARAVPIIWRYSDEEILNLVSKLNGVLLPGGFTPFRNEDGSLTEHSRKVELILNKVKEFNDEGTYYPVLGICMGMQQIAQIEAPYKDTVELCIFDSGDVADSVILKDSAADSQLYNDMPEHLRTAIQNERITYNNHYDGILLSAWNKYSNLKENYHLIGTSYDRKGVEYVAMFESKDYPIWGFQFHPEKNSFSWNPNSRIPHSPSAIELTQFFSNFFIKGARRNFNKLDPKHEIFEHFAKQTPLVISFPTM
ncbi:unnamed protein product [Moneuplotes crassus]|uniref:folate gamma-glutamyl hydrolase n=1 Tax=Euplotes crassus TaxID=5936 RepID=A0AAD2CVT9_EUPCR|nr:unnamed protein product [Moneuplotes crassus]